MDGATTANNQVPVPRGLFRPLRPPHLLILIFALPFVARAQWTTQVHRGSAADSASGFYCTGDSCNGYPRERFQLAGVVMAFRESEARAVERGLNLTATVERYRADVTGYSEQVAEASRNVCDARALELRASSDAAVTLVLATADRVMANASDGFRRAAVERAALGRRADSTDERLQTYVADLRFLEQTLNATRWELHVTSKDVSTVQSETTRNFSSLSNALGSALTSIDERINSSADLMMELLITTNRQESAISNLNHTQHNCEVSWKQQASSLNAELNSTKLEVERLSGELGRIRDNYERLFVNVRNISALLTGCPSGWQRNGSWCYFVSKFTDSWRGSRERCLMLNSNLVTSSSPVVNTFLSAYMSRSGISYAWLGATDAGNRGNWTWLTGERFFNRGSTSGYVNFASGEPSTYCNTSSGPCCLKLYKSGVWYAADCYNSADVFCRMYRPLSEQ